MIVALLITNFILFVMLYGNQVKGLWPDSNSDQNLSEVVELLASRDIMIENELKTFPDSLPGLRLTYEMFDEEYKASQALSEPMEYVNGFYTNGVAILDVKENQTLEYSVVEPTSIVKEMDERKATEVALLKLSEFDLYGNYNEIVRSEQVDNGDWEIELSQFYQGYFLENAYIKVTVRNEEVILIQKKWFSQVEQLSDQHPIISLDHALFKAVPLIKQKYDKATITDIQLGYRMIFSPLAIDVQSGEAAPYWLVMINGTDPIYIPASVTE